MSLAHPIKLMVVLVLANVACADEDRLIEPVRPYVVKVVDSLASLPRERQPLLGEVADYIAQRVASGKDVQLNFICTHNSRRSHLAQVWCQVAAEYYDVPRIKTYSGGIEATACNMRTVRALRRAGLSVVATGRGDNPIYLIQFSEARDPIRAFSKVYAEHGNPMSDFAALMCCSDADARCPVVSGAEKRFSLHYEDPKEADGTPDEATRYDERSLQIAREMFFVMSRVAQQMSTTTETLKLSPATSSKMPSR